jgi:preprotein translocase SecE subunit
MAKNKVVKDALVEEEKVKETKNLETEKKEKVEKKESKKEHKDKKDGYFKVTMRELRKVSWPTFGEVMKYSLAVIIFCLIFVGFFELVQLLATYIKWVFR